MSTPRELADRRTHSRRTRAADRRRDPAGVHRRPVGGDALRLRGTLLVSEPLGAESLVHLELPIRPVNTEEVREVARDADATVLQELRDAAETARTPFRARFTGSYRGRSGEPVEVAVDARQLLYVFDLESGVAIGPEPASRPVAA